MGRYKTDTIYWENKYYSPEDLISWGFSCAPKHPKVTIDVAAHILREAFIMQDNDLFNAGNELMGAAGSPRNFAASESSKQASTDNNRPSVSPVPKIPDGFLNVGDTDEEEWDSQYDGIFNEDLNPQAIFNKLEAMSSPRVSDYYPRFFVFFRVLLYLSWIGNSQKNFLKWCNCHWEQNWEKEYNFKFGNNIKKELRDTDMSDWNDNTCNGSDIGKDYRLFAKKVLDSFAVKVNDGKIIDVAAYYKQGVKSRINEGKKLSYPF